MTNAQLDHLKRIDAHLEHLLAIAAKRTPGRWKAHVNNKRAITVGPINGPTVLSGEYFDIEDEDAAFIAACSNNAEAGWRATRAAIALLVSMGERQHDIETAKAAFDAFESILAAFPLEMLATQQE